MDVNDFDLIIIGSGSANSLIGPEYDDSRVAMIESGTFGGTCLNVGCIPTKMYVYAAEVAGTIRSAGTYGIDADIFAPCALGAIINDDTLKVFKYDIIAGAANNQLARSRHAKEVHAKGILYAPDYVINAAGLINVYGELNDWDQSRSMKKAGEINKTLLDVFRLADDESTTTAAAADRLAEQRIADVRHLQRSWV